MPRPAPSPTAHEPLETRTKSRVVAAIGALFSLMAAYYGAALLPRSRAIAALCAIACVVYLAAAFLAHRTRRYRVPGGMIGGAFFAVMTGSNLAQDGLSAAFLPVALLFCTLVPQMATYLLGPRGGVAMGALTIAYLSVLFAYLRRHAEGGGDPALALKYVVACGAIVVGLALSILITRARDLLVLELRAAHDALDVVHAAEQRRLEEETDLAARIRTALLPRDLYVEGLEIAAAMLPAAEVGGDYYDVLPAPGGAWLCIGDVAGHGLHAGLTMLMMQSAVSALVQDDDAPSPGEALAALNTTLYQNIRQRMGRDDHATLTLLRYHRDGEVRFVGAHEEILVLRAAGARCEVIATPGPWVGAWASLAGQVTESRLALGDGDLLVLYTDGLTEARDGGHRQFGLDRVEAEILRARGRPVEAIRDAVLGAVHAFCPALADDVAVLIARYHAPAPGGAATHAGRELR